MTRVLTPSRWLQFGLAILFVLVLGLGLAWISPGFDVGSFAVIVLLSTVFLVGFWVALWKERIPPWIGVGMVGAALLRLGLGVVWYLALPIWGHGTEVEKAGYIMSDAYNRDTAAWSLAQSGDPLTDAFKEYRLADQYGGMLFLSAAVYRFLGRDVHQPLMMVVLTASISGAVVLFTWAFTNRLWGESAASKTSWILALYPEAALLGSSQMREAFMMTLVSMALFGLISYWQDRDRQKMLWILAALGLGLPLSTMFAILLLVLLILVALILFRERIFRNWILWVVLGGLLLVGIGAVWISAERIYPEGATNPLGLIREWFVFAGRWEKRVVAQSSGWFKKILGRSPEWLHIWLILGYGTLQPFLPAALIATGNWLWRVIAIWRSFGWTLLLVLLMYAPLRVMDKFRQQWVPAGITVVIWGGILLAAFRGGGDQWDNPRYRVIFVSLQVSLAAWVWIKQRESRDLWLRRILIGLGLVFSWFIPWYLRRYSDTFTWPVIDLFKTVALGFITAFMYWLWDWARCQDIGEE